MKITKLFQFVLLCTSVFILTACPYSSETPLSTADTKAPDFLIGNWAIADNTTGDIVKIAKSTGYDLKIDKINGEDGTTTNYSGHITMINNTMFLNLAETSEFGKTYYFYKIQKINEENVKLFSVTLNIREIFDNSDKLKAFFASNMQNSYFFDIGEENYYKIK